MKRAFLRSLALAGALLLLYAFCAIRQTPIGIGLRVPAVFAQQALGLACPGTTLPLTSLTLRANNGQLFNWGCQDTNGSLYIGNNGYIAPNGSLSGALSIFGTANATLSITGPLVVSSSVTVPQNIALNIPKGGLISFPNIGQNLTISGPLIAGIYQIFSVSATSGNVFFYGGSGTEKVFPQWFGATGNNEYTGVTCSATSTLLTISGTSRNPFLVNDPIIVAGCGVAGTDLVTTVASVNGTTSITTNLAASTTQSSPVLAERFDDTPALQLWSTSVWGSQNASGGRFGPNTNATFGLSQLYVPRGVYVARKPIQIYAGTILTGEHGNVLGGAILTQGDRTQPLLNLNPQNFDNLGGRINSGNGNATLRNIIFKSAYINDNFTNAPTIQFQNAWNINSDYEFDHVAFQDTAGWSITMGYAGSLTGTVTSGATTATMASGSSGEPCTSTFTTQAISPNGSQIIIVGAGVASANLTVNITGIAGCVITFTPATSTTVTNPAVYAGIDNYDPIKLNHVEFDGPRGGINAVGNAAGQVYMDTVEGYSMVRGMVNFSTLRSVGLQMGGVNQCDACGYVPAGNTMIGIQENAIDNSDFGWGDVSIQNLRSSRQNLSGVIEGGNIVINKARSCSLSYLNMVDPEAGNGGNNHGLKLYCDYIAVTNNRITSNTLTSGTYTGADLLHISNTTPPKSINVFNNFFQNTNGSSFSQFIASDTTIASTDVVTTNSYVGNATFTVNANIIQKITLTTSLTTTAATSDNVSIPGMLSGGHCLLQPTNASADTLLTGTFVSAKTTNQITVTHAATAGATFDIACTPY